MSSKEQSYQELRQKLDSIIAELQQDSLDIDHALKLHKEGQELVKLLEQQLTKAEAKIKTIKP